MITIINNHTKHLHSLINAIELLDKPFRVIDINSLKSQTVQSNCRLIILTGGQETAVVNNNSFYQFEIDLIKNTTLPILGICLGAELLADVFGSRLEYKRCKIKGNRIIKIIKANDPVCFEKEIYRVYASHHWEIGKLSNDLEVVARSKTDRIEIFRHKQRPIYGFQFHPEVMYVSTDGRILLKNFIDVYY